MPPPELSRKKNASIMDRSDTPEAEGFPAGSSDVTDNTHFLRGSSSIQSMLKNTIETRDVGKFSINPSQLPVPTHRAAPSAPSTPLSSGTARNRPSRIPSRRSYTRQHADDDIDFHQSFDYPYPSSPGSNSAISSYQTQSPRPYREPSQGSNQDERSYSMSQSSVINHGFSNPGLHSPNRLQVQGDARNLRPRSPYAYPTRLKRPGYRPSSPALSELHKDNQGVSAGGYQETNPERASPMHRYTVRKVPATWQQGSNHSDSLFQRYSPSPVSRYSSARSSSPSSPRMPTPGPLLSLDQNSVSRESLDLLSDKSGWTTRKSPSPSPVFYDYTEAFEEENHFRKSVVTLAGGVIPEHMDIGFQEPERKASTPEMPACSDVPKALLQGNAGSVGVSELESTVNRKALSQIPRRVIGSNHSSIIEDAQGQIAPVGRHQLRRKAKSFVVERPRSGEKDLAPPVSSKYSKVQRHTFADLSAVRSTPKASLASPPCSISSSESIYSVQSFSRPEQPVLDPPTERLSRIDLHSGTSGKLPFNSDRRTPDLESEGQILLPPPSPRRPASFDYWSDSEPSQIFAPTPERSLSSPGHRDRFSRIFSIGQGSADTDEVNENCYRPTRYHITERHIKEQEIGNSGATNVSAFRTENSLTDPPKVALEMRRPVIDSKFHDESELDQAPEEEPRMFTTTHLDSQQVTEKGPKQVMVASMTSEVSFSPRIGRKGKPAISLPVSPSQVSTVDIIRLNDPVRNSDPGGKALVERNNTKPHIMKRHPSLPNIPSFISYSPPPNPNPDTLPFSFKPLLAGKTDSVSVANLQDYDSEVPDNEPDEDHTLEKPYDSEEYKIRVSQNSNSTESLPSSRPWNLDTSYPWTDQNPELEVTVPQLKTGSLQSTNKPPRFKLKVHRASSSVTGSAKLTKQPPSLELSAIRKRNMSNELSQSGAYSCKPRTSITISQSNSSHASQVMNQYSESISSPLASSAVSPSIKLVPPSPGLNLEVRSLFSDDSSQIQPKGSIRKRISQLKLIAARANSTESTTDTNPGVPGSAVGKSRASGRTSRQDATPSARIYNLRHLKRRVVEKVRGWFHRGEEKVRFWGSMMTSKGLKDNSPSTEVSSGV